MSKHLADQQLSKGERKKLKRTGVVTEIETGLLSTLLPKHLDDNITRINAAEREKIEAFSHLPRIHKTFYESKAAYIHALLPGLLSYETSEYETKKIHQPSHVAEPSSNSLMTYLLAKTPKDSSIRTRH